MEMSRSSQLRQEFVLCLNSCVRTGWNKTSSWPGKGSSTGGARKGLGDGTGDSEGTAPVSGSEDPRQGGDYRRPLHSARSQRLRSHLVSCNGDNAACSRYRYNLHYYFHNPCSWYCYNHNSKHYSKRHHNCCYSCSECRCCDSEKPYWKDPKATSTPHL